MEEGRNRKWAFGPVGFAEWFGFKFEGYWESQKDLQLDSDMLRYTVLFIDHLGKHLDNK